METAGIKESEVTETNEQILHNYGTSTDVDNSKPMNNHVEEESLHITKLRFLRRYFILEPPMLLIYFAFNLSTTVFQNQLLYQSCTAVFQYNDAECRPMLGINNSTVSSQQLNNKVQLYVSHIVMALSLVDCIMPAVLSLFIGPWSDKFGRRPVLITTIIGYIVRYLVSGIFALIALKAPSNPWLYILTPIPSSICGGTCAMMIVAYCYISDVAPTQFKGLRMVLNNAAMGVGLLLGNLTSGYLFAATNMATVFFISMASMILALIYIILANEESLKIQKTPLWTKIRELFRFSHVVDMIRSCVAKRVKYQRAFIWLTMIALIITNFTSKGEANVFYLFLRKKFDITVNEYNTYNSVANVILMIGGVLSIVLLRKYLRFSTVSMAMLSLVSLLLESTVRAAAQQFWELYLSASLGFMSGITGPMLLTTLSFNAPATETGKLFSLTTSLETITPLGAAPLYTSVYDATLDFYPGLFNIISAVLYLLSFICIATIFGVAKRNGIIVSPPVRQKI